MNILYTRHYLTTRMYVFSGLFLLIGYLPSLVVPHWVSQLLSKTTPTEEPVALMATAISLDSTECSVAIANETTTDFVPVVQCRFEHPGIITYQPPMFADVDGDGETEIVVILDHSPNGFAVINPITCQAEHIVDVGEEMWYKDGGLALGDVDGNGRADVFIPAGSRIQRWEFSPTTNAMEKVWQTDHGVATAERAHLDIYDLNQDGEPEIIPNIGRMVNAVTGQVYGDEVPALNTQGKGLFAFTADALPEPAPAGFGNVELLYGTQIWRYNFQDQYWFKVKSLPNYEHWGRDACVSIADMDLDGDVDAVVTHYDEAYTGEAIIWDLQTETILGGTTAWDYPGNKGSRMNISNLDDDPYPEMVMTSRFTIFTVDDIINSDGFGNIIWLDRTSDESGHTQLTSFDFDGNGTYEIAYRDETHLRVFSGLGTGTPEGEYPSTAEVLLNTGEFNSCQSYTGMEYPTIGDVDQDGQAEMVATCAGYLSVYESGSLPWRNATRVWNTQAFTVTNVNQDGTIPTVMTENHTVYNNFLAQVTGTSTADSTRIAVPDALVVIDEVINECGENVRLELEICNQGAAPLRNGTPIAIYQQNPTEVRANLVQVSQVPQQLEIGLCTNVTIYGLPAAPANESVHYFVVVNDEGVIMPPYVLDARSNGGTFPVTDIKECDYTNNIADSLVTAGVASQSQIDTTICDGDLFYVGGIAYSESGIYINNLPNASGCDSVVTLYLEVMPAASNYFQTEICAGSSFTYFDGQVFRDTGTFYDTLVATNGCDSISILDIKLLPVLRTQIDETICPDDSFIFNNQTLTEAGTYVDSLVAHTGCDSVVILNLSIGEPSPAELKVGICESEFYTFNGRDISVAGTYFDTLQNVYGCDSIVELQLTVKQPIFVDLNENFCTGSGYLFDNQWLTNAGVYTATFNSYDNCDSTVTLNLFEFPTFEHEQTATICYGETYLLGEEAFTDGGYYIRTLTSEAGCDSVVTLSLNVLGTIYTEVNETVCAGEVIQFGEQEIRSTGTYSDTLTSVVSGCDSIVFLNLSVLNTSTEDVNVTLCAGESYQLGDEFYTTSGNYTQRFTAANGCDSLINLHLNIVENSTAEALVTICTGESYTVNDQIYTETGVYENTLTNAAGCDSIFKLQLFVLPTFESNLQAQICEGESYTLGDTDYSVSGDYQQILSAQNGCDSIVNLNLEVIEAYAVETRAEICAGEVYNWNGETYTEAGVYRDALISTGGCDSLIALILDVLPHHETTELQQICTGETYHWNNEILSEAGEYTRVYSATTGCDSTVTLTLELIENIENQEFVNICAGENHNWNGTIYTASGIYEQTFVAANSCDSTVALTLLVLPEQRVQMQATTCEGHPYFFGERRLYTSGLYTQTFTATNGCDSIVELQLDLKRNTATIANQVICEGELVPFGTREVSTGGQYIDTLVAANGCDSFAVLNLTVLPAPNAEESATICKGETYRFGDQDLLVSGTYSRFVTAENGCRGEIVLELEVLPNPENYLQTEICAGSSYLFDNQELTESGNYELTLAAANGCDSLVFLELEVLEDIQAVIYPQICNGETYRNEDYEFSESGTYTLQLTAANGCDSTLTIHLETLPHITNDMSITICEGDTYTVGPNEYSDTGVYSDTLQAVNGCDSIVVLGLEVLPSPTVNDVQTICKGESYYLNGREFTVAGEYLERMTTVAGCDSTVFLQLSVLPIEERLVSVTLCEGESYTLGSRTYQTAGTYIDTLTASTGCDSIILLNISTLSAAKNWEAATICAGESYFFNGQDYHTSGTYTHTLTAANGCDSIIELTLTMMEEATEQINKTICAGEEVRIGDNVYNQTGVYTNQLRSVNGCDSILTLELRVIDAVTTTEEASICTGDSYKFYGEVFYEAGTYEHRSLNANGCEDVAILVLTIRPEQVASAAVSLCAGDVYPFGNIEITASGLYADTLTAFNGCDSIINLQVTVNEPTEELINLTICAGDSVFIAGAYRKTADFFEENLLTSAGCDSIVFTQLEVEAAIDITGLGGEICSGDSIQISANGADNYEWFPKEGMSCTDCPTPIVAPTETTTYTVRAKGCLDNNVETQVTVFVKPTPQLELTESQEIIFGQTVTLTALTTTEDPFIYWTAQDKIFCSECESITVSPEDDVIYTVMVEDANGCTIQDEVSITVRKDCVEDDFFIPNMISPNNDGANDEFYITSDIPTNLKHLRIYDRWGEQMFETSDWNTHWRGDYRGQAVNPGVYVYYLEAVCPNGEPFKKVGNITVLK